MFGQVTSAAVCSKAVVLLLLINCLLLFPLFVESLCLVLIVLCSTYALKELSIVMPQKK